MMIPLLFALITAASAQMTCMEHACPEDGQDIPDPDINRNVSELITSKGYPVEEYVVQTEDGFLLSMQRIPYGRKGPMHLKGKRPAVYLQHGLLSASSDFVINFPEQSLGFILADAGYDVWLGNIRGNTYSRKHIKYTPEMKEFWDYSFQEMGAYDLPAMIDYVLNKTGQSQLAYIGHSQGTTAAFALLSDSPEYNKKVNLFVALAPVTSVGYTTNPIKYLAPFTKDFEFLSKMLGVKELLPSEGLMEFVSKYICDKSEPWLCGDVMSLMFGRDLQELNVTRVGVYAAHTPAGSSTKSVIHYGQLFNSKTFSKFDYGKHGNLARYSQAVPPEYDVSKITTPVALMWSLNDALGDPVDVRLLTKKLKSLVASYEVPLPIFNHGDFVLAIHANGLLYKEVQSLLKKFVN